MSEANHLVLQSMETLLGPLAEPVELHVGTNGLRLVRSHTHVALGAPRTSDLHWTQTRFRSTGVSAVQVRSPEGTLDLRHRDTTLLLTLSAIVGSGPLMLYPLARRNPFIARAGTLALGQGGVCFIPHSGPMGRSIRTPRRMPWQDIRSIRPGPGTRVAFELEDHVLDLECPDADTLQALLRTAKSYLSARPLPELPPAVPLAGAHAVIWHAADGHIRTGLCWVCDDTLHLHPSHPGSAPALSAPAPALRIVRGPDEHGGFSFTVGDRQHTITWIGPGPDRADLVALQTASFQSTDRRPADSAALVGRWDTAILVTEAAAMTVSGATIMRDGGALLIALGADTTALPAGTTARLTLTRQGARADCSVQIGRWVGPDELSAPCIARVRRLGEPVTTHHLLLIGEPQGAPNRRQDHRCEVDIPIRLHCAEHPPHWFDATLHDISASGAGIAMADAGLPAGSLVRVWDVLDGATDHGLQATVVRSHRGPGTPVTHGLRFLPMSARTQNQLARKVVACTRAARPPHRGGAPPTAE